MGPREVESQKDATNKVAADASVRCQAGEGWTSFSIVAGFSQQLALTTTREAKSDH